MICLSVCDLYLVNENVTLIQMAIDADVARVSLQVEDYGCERTGTTRVFSEFVYEIVSERYLTV